MIEFLLLFELPLSSEFNCFQMLHLSHTVFHRLSYRTGQDTANCDTCRNSACIIYRWVSDTISESFSLANIFILVELYFFSLKFHLNPRFRDSLHTKAHICTSAAAVSKHIVKFVSVAVKLWRTKEYKIMLLAWALLPIRIFKCKMKNIMTEFLWCIPHMDFIHFYQTNWKIHSETVKLDFFFNAS